MRCPYCDGDADRVIDSRPAEQGRAIRRRRSCTTCGQRYSTYERVELSELTVRKRGGVVEPFDATKIAAGMSKATANLPIDGKRVREAAARVEARIRALGRIEVSGERVGAEVLEALRDLDHVAYMRFASVYKSFTSPEDFRRELATLEKASPPKTREG